MTDARSAEQTFYGGFGAARKRSLVSAVCGCGNARSGSCARNKSSRGRRSPSDVAMTTGPSKSAKHPSHPPREGDGERRVRGSVSAGGDGKGPPGREEERGRDRGVTMGTLSLEICREHAGWSVHCFNARFPPVNVSP